MNRYHPLRIESICTDASSENQYDCMILGEKKIETKGIEFSSQEFKSFNPLHISFICHQTLEATENSTKITRNTEINKNHQMTNVQSNIAEFKIGNHNICEDHSNDCIRPSKDFEEIVVEVQIPSISNSNRKPVNDDSIMCSNIKRRISNQVSNPLLNQTFERKITTRHNKRKFAESNAMQNSLEKGRYNSIQSSNSSNSNTSNSLRLGSQLSTENKNGNSNPINQSLGESNNSSVLLYPRAIEGHDTTMTNWYDHTKQNLPNVLTPSISFVSSTSHSCNSVNGSDLA